MNNNWTGDSTPDAINHQPITLPALEYKIFTHLFGARVTLPFFMLPHEQTYEVTVGIAKHSW